MSCCNETVVYRSLFAQLCEGEPYTVAHAQQWLEWAINGWQDKAHFVFLALDETGLPVAACDIKSNDKDDAEIGFWRAESGRGAMTNCVIAMLRHGIDNGFRSFHAYVRPENVPSASLLSRVGFLQDALKDDDTLFRFALCSPSIQSSE